MKKAYVLLFDGYADWEIGHVLAELRRIGNLPVATVGFTDAQVVSMGGLRVSPDTTLAAVVPDDVRLFILPGGTLWEQAYPAEALHALLQALDRQAVPMAAICAATTVFAKAGLLQGKKHTSNALKYLRDHVPGYQGESDYVQELVVTDGHVTTASGLGSIELTRNIMEALDIATPQLRDLWFRAVKYGEYPEGIG
ncbi:MAG TPA: DJ-1/PfpI family protein [Solidesulfovibrio magneticus]|nr:DJ-1/PfpI family protein [Solidesulfovibrio magneticus]